MKITKEDISNLFKIYGELQEVLIINSGEYVDAYVEFIDIDDADDAY